MCGRFTNKHSWRKLHDLYRLTDTRPNFPPRYNIAPTDSVPVVRRRDGQRELVMLRWGLIPYWAKDEKIGYSTINARAETVADKPAFKEAWHWPIAGAGPAPEGATHRVVGRHGRAAVATRPPAQPRQKSPDAVPITRDYPDDLEVAHERVGGR